MDIKTFLNKEETQAVNNAVQEAEEKTSAEIVPVITDASGAYDRGEDLFGLLLALIAVAAGWLLFQGLHADASWQVQGTPALTYNLIYIILTIIVFFTIGAALATRLWFIRHLFTARSEMTACVERGAVQAFQINNISSTKGGNGVLIYISLFERMVRVMGDSSISEKLNDADFAEVRDIILKGIKDGKPGEGLCDGIRLCGDKLAPAFPIAEDDENELSNELIFWEQNL